MLALISLTNLRNALVELLPASGETSWMEEGQASVEAIYLGLRVVGYYHNHFTIWYCAPRLDCQIA